MKRTPITYIIKYSYDLLRRDWFPLGGLLLYLTDDYFFLTIQWNSSGAPKRWPVIMCIEDYSILWLRRTMQDRQKRPDSRTHGDSIVLLYEVTVRCRYNAVNFLTSIHKRHPIARPSGWGMGCLLWIQRLINSLSQFLQWFMQYLTMLDRVITTLCMLKLIIQSEPFLSWANDLSHLVF